MAIYATHVRFSLEMIGDYAVKNSEPYFSGTLYPDSRYPTGIARALTHPNDFESWNIHTLTDFQKGWHSHLSCDKMIKRIMRRLIPSAFIGNDTQCGEQWIKQTALKILLDIEDSKQFDMREFLPYLHRTEAPNHEPSDKLDLFYDAVRSNYERNESLTIESYEGMWSCFNVPDEIVFKVKTQALAYQSDPEVCRLINTIFDSAITESRTR